VVLQGLDGAVPDHSTFSKNRHGRFRDSDLLRKLFEETVARCIAEGLVGGEGFAVDASMINADANRQHSTPGDEWEPPDDPGHAVREYLAVLDEAAFGGATPVVPKFISGSDPASRWTGANGGLAFFAYCTNYLIDLKHAVIMDVEATTAVRQAEVTAQRVMLDRTQERFGIWPARLAADTGYGSAKNLAWLVHEKGIEPHIPVFEKSARMMAPSRAPTSSMITPTTATHALAASSSDAIGRMDERRRQGLPATASTSTAPGRPAATHAISSPPPPRTSGSSPSWSRCLSRYSPERADNPARPHGRRTPASITTGLFHHNRLMQMRWMAPASGI
jgi:hypothetical protein